MPSRYRAQLEEGCVLAPGRDGQLEIYPKDVYEAMVKEIIDASSGKEGRRYVRSAVRYAESLTLDKSGRVNLKAEHIDWAGLEAEVTILGVFDHIELWNPAAYAADVAKDRYREEDDD